MTDEATHEVELNFYYLHSRDCKVFVKLANQEQSPLRSLYTRHSILSAVFASEALINRVLNDFYLLDGGYDRIERLSITEKWYIAPLLCGATQPSFRTFDCSKQPFQSFDELVKIRNWLVHPKVGNYVGAVEDPASTITIPETGLELPWIEVLRGEAWPITKIPKNPFEMTGVHAKTAPDILQSMTDELNVLMSDSVTEDWLQQVSLRAKGSRKEQRAYIDSLWGGYTPSEESEA